MMETNEEDVEYSSSDSIELNNFNEDDLSSDDIQSCNKDLEVC